MGVVAGTRRLASVDDLRIAYESVGTGAPAVVFIHGILQNSSYFAAQISHFSKSRQVVTLDLRGHGESSGVAEVTLDDFAKDVVAVVDEVGLEGAVLCGHSMAGVVALKAAAQRPDLVRGVALLDGTVLFPEAVRQAGLTNLVPALATDHWLDALRAYFSRTILGPEDSPVVTDRVMAAVGQARPEFIRSFFISLSASDHADDLVNARCPVLYVHAKAPADLERLRQLRPDAMVGEVVGSGHYAMLSVPDQVNAMIERFLEVGI